ncbi:MAG: DUF1329 domain-containing protein, partial [Nevskia sp.]|nr:DUF1329 domain-containing protein [Nevskia sp.]
GQTFFDTSFELIPECIVVEAEPTGFPRAPVSKKRVYLDARNSVFPTYITFDRRGEMWKSFEPGFCQYSNDKLTIKDPEGYPDWSWLYVHSHDIQSNRMDRIEHAYDCAGGYVSRLTDAGEDVYNKYMTVQAISRLGSA